MVEVLSDPPFTLLRDTIASYKTMAAADKPTTDDAKMQTWVVQSSKAANKNLAPYYKAYVRWRVLCVCV